MHFFGGALTEERILALPWTRFMMYQEYMVYIQRWNSKEGSDKNKMLDRVDQIKYGRKGKGYDGIDAFKAKARGFATKN